MPASPIRALLGIALCAALLAGCGAPAPGVKAGADPRAGVIAQVQQLLDRRAGSLNAHAEAGYLAPLTPQALAVERPLAEGAVSAPVTGFSFYVARSSVADASFPLTHVRVRLNYRYQDLPQDNVFSIPMTYSIDRSGGALIVTSSTPEPGSLPAWATGPVLVARTEHFIALSRPDVTTAPATLALAEQARAQLQTAIPFPFDPVFLVVLAKDYGEYRTLAGQGVDLGAARVAQANSTFESTPTVVLVQGRYMMVNLQKLADEKTGLQTFKHELSHLALARVTRPITPGWVAESAAMYLAGQKVNWTSRVSSGSFDTLRFADLSRTRQLGAYDPTGGTAGLEYAYAAGAAGYLIERFGAAKFWAFYRSYADVAPVTIYDSIPSQPAAEGQGPLADLAQKTTVNALKANFGLTEAELDTGVRDWVRSHPA